MTMGACCTLFAISQECKVLANRCRKIDLNMGIAAIRLGAIIAEEMKTRRDAMRGWFMRKIAVLTGGAFTMPQVFLADCKLVDVVLEFASVAAGARSS